MAARAISTFTCGRGKTIFAVEVTEEFFDADDVRHLNALPAKLRQLRPGNVLIVSTTGFSTKPL